MKKVRVVGINGYFYTLDDGVNKYIKNIEFYSKKKPQESDLIYISEKILNEKTLLSFIEPYNNAYLKTDDIIKVISKNDEYYLQREYG